MDIEGEMTVFDHNESPNMNNDIEGLLHDTLREGPNDEAKKFLKLVEEGEQELYPGCKIFSNLSFIIGLFIYKCDHKLSNIAIAELLNFFRDVLPNAKLPSSFKEAKNVLEVLGLDYTKIDACLNDFMLHWEEHANATSCHVCQTPRWKSNDKDQPNGKTYKIPVKILRYFPIKKMF